MTRVSWSSVIALLCAISLLPSAAQAADPFPDDHGDSPVESTFVLPGGAPSNSTIEIDTDEDWFRFVALPGVTYRIDVTAGSIWDTALEMRGPDASTVLVTTNSSRSAVPAKSTITWKNSGVADTYYIGISGYLRFTTGTCSIAVQAYQLSITNGQFAGGNSLTITNGILGSGSDITSVLVGGVPATITGQGVNWVTIILPAIGSAGVKNIVVQSTSMGATTLTGVYTVNPAGHIADLGVSPSSGSYAGGYTVIITGTNLGNGSDITNVTLCETPVQSITSQSATQIVVVAGAALFTGTGDVCVFSTSFGRTEKVNGFSYEADPLAGDIQFSASAYSVAETGVTVTVTVSRQGGSVGAVSVDYATSDGTALAGADYTAQSGTLNWSNGDSTARIITVPVLNDRSHELDETFTVHLARPTRAGLGAPASATVTILDDDPLAGLPWLQLLLGQ